MNAAVCGVRVNTIKFIEAGEEEIVKDFGTVWEEPHLLQIGVQGAWRQKERVAHLKIKDGIFFHVP